MTTYTFKEEVNLSELAKRIIDTGDLYEIEDLYGDYETAVKEVTKQLVNDPLAVISYLVGTVEELQA